MNAISYPVTRTCTETIIEQMNNSFYKLETKETKYGICFFCRIKFKNNNIPFLFISNPFSDSKYLANKKSIKLTKNNGEKINIKFGKTLYINIGLSIIMREIEENNEIEFLEIDDNLYEEDPEIFLYKQPIYIIHYDKNKSDNFVSYGNLNNINRNELIFSCNMSNIYSNSVPIFNQRNNKIIGIYKSEVKKSNRGIFFKHLIKGFIQEYIKVNKRLKNSQKFKNEIEIFFEIKEEDKNKNIYFLDKYDNLKEINVSDVDIYLNNNPIQKENKKNYFQTAEEGDFCIKLIFNGFLTDSSSMFSGCEKIKKINFVSFNTTYITNMEYMFYECKNLKNINLLSFDTNIVQNMSYIFYQCINLVYFDFSSFNTNNVVNMSNMFNGCESLKYIDLSCISTKNVVDMSNMFNGCKKLISINLTSFDTKKVTDMRYMFNECTNLLNLDLSSFDTRNITETSHMFLYCKKLDNLDLLIHNIKNISNNDNEIYQEYLIRNLTDSEFKENPIKLKYKYDFTNDGITQSNIYNFEVFVGLKDKNEYIVFRIINNKSLDVMRIIDKKLITSLQESDGVNFIKYYMKNIKEDYLLSSTYGHDALIWDIQNNYNLKYKLQTKFFGDIHYALLLFNLYNEDYILISTINSNILFAYYEKSKLYKFEDNTPFVKDIYNTNNNHTNYMIPWIYNKKYYIIDLCNKKISINNLFEDENYAELSKEPEGIHLSGYLYDENYLCVSDQTNSNIRIWDLVNKTIIKQINYNASYAYMTIPWNSKYTIVGCGGCFVIINIEENKVIKYIEVKKSQALGIKKIKINEYGECLIVFSSKEFNNIGGSHLDIKLFGF